MQIQKLGAVAIVVIAVGLLLGCAPEKISAGKIIDNINANIKSELQLTPEQNQKLMDFTDTIKKSIADSNQASKANNAEWIAMIEAPQLDQAKIREKVKAHAAESAANTDAWLDTYLPKLAAFHDSLTAEQLKKASAYFQKWMTRFTP